LGIDALKIEGRMRSPLYTYLTSKIYSNAIKRAKQGKKTLINPRERELLEVVFNRGFTKGYLLEENVMQREYPQSRGLFLGNAHFDGIRLTVKVKSLRIGDGLTLYRNHEKIGGFEIKDFKGKKDCLFLRPPFTIPDGEYQVYKTKDSEFDSIRRVIDSIHFPLSSKKGRKKNPNFAFATQRKKTKGELSFYLSSLKSLKSVLPYADRVYFELNKHFNDAAVMCNKREVEFVVLMPRLAFDLPEVEADNIMINSIDQFEKYVNRKLYGHYSMNFFNSLTIPKLFQYTLSVELSKEDIKEIALHYFGRLEMMVFGKIELMVTRDVTLQEGLLIDRKQKKFPVYRDRLGFTHIINSSNLFLLDFLDELEEFGINSFGIDLRRRTPEFSEMVARAFFERNMNKKKDIKKKCGSKTSGHYLRGVT
jgi:putative protease